LVASVIAAKYDFLTRYRWQVIAYVEEVADLVDETDVTLLLGDILANNHHSIRLVTCMGLVFELGYLLMQKL